MTFGLPHIVFIKKGREYIVFDHYFILNSTPWQKKLFLLITSEAGISFCRGRGGAGSIPCSDPNRSISFILWERFYLVRSSFNKIRKKYGFFIENSGRMFYRVIYWLLSAWIASDNVRPLEGPGGGGRPPLTTADL